MLHRDYHILNFIAFNLAGFACISLVVFLSSTQPFFLDLVLQVNAGAIGSVIGTLGFIDELVSVVTAPLLGALCDNVNTTRMVGGTRTIVCVGFGVIALGLMGYAKLGINVGRLYVLRGLFAVGVTGCMSMVPVMLNELSNSDFRLKSWRQQDNEVAAGEELDARTSLESDEFPPIEEHLEWDNDNRRNGKYAACIGISTGLGAIFAVSFLLTMPSKISDSFSMPIKDSLQLTYFVVGCGSLFVGAGLSRFLYDSIKTDRPLVVEEKPGYFSLLYRGAVASKGNFRIQLAYMGSFVARSTTVATSVFIPLLVYNFYYKSGMCNSGGDKEFSKQNCRDGYIFAAILTGVSQTVALMSAPIWAWLIDHPLIGSIKSLFVSSGLGMVGCFGLCALGSSSTIYDPRTLACFIVVSFMGLSQTGVIITSMSLISSLKTSPDTVIGSISGLYSLCGGVGILIITKFGGLWSDHWILGPFFILGLFNLLLSLASAIRL